MAREHQNRLGHVEEIHDDRKKKQLRLEDDMEDFLDESTPVLLNTLLFN